MTDLERYEREYGRQNSIINSYFRGDFVSRHMLGSFFCYTISFFLVFLLIVLCNLDLITENPNILEILPHFTVYLKYYGIGLVIFEVITVIVYNYRYHNGTRNTRIQRAKLKRLYKKYGAMEREEED